MIRVEKGAIYQGLVYDYSIYCTLNNMQEIVLDTAVPDLIDVCPFIFIGRKIFVSIKALFIQKECDKNLYSFYGEIRKKKEEYFFINDFIEIEINESDIISENIPLNELGTYYFGRLDIKTISDNGYIIGANPISKFKLIK